MARSINLSVPSRFYNPGTYTPGPVNVPLGVTSVIATFTRESWPLTPSDTVLQIRLEASYDGGATWPEFAAGAWVGGVRLNKQGVPVTTEQIQRSLAQPDNPNRRLRAVATVVSRLQTAVTLESA